jgi:hypothetical protein
MEYIAVKKWDTRALIYFALGLCSAVARQKDAVMTIFDALGMPLLMGFLMEPLAVFISDKLPQYLPTAMVLYEAGFNALRLSTLLRWQ